MHISKYIVSVRPHRSSIDAYWRAANYLLVGQIYLLDNPLLREPLRFFIKVIAITTQRKLSGQSFKEV
jgi:phosphoketolase